jgi:glycerol-3-phosphate acyltransferase PlsX
MWVVLDAMGGDKGISVVVEGALLAARNFKSKIILVGQKEVVEPELAKYDLRGLNIKFRHASEVVEMKEPPSQAVRKKKDSSIRVGLNLIKEGEAQAFVSAGNTGAVMGTALLVLGTMKELERPAIAARMPTLTGSSILLDVGANLDCKPRHLAHFALMGNVYAKDIMRLSTPRVGLLSVGEEEGKGNELTKEAFKELEELPIKFIGNVEGRDVYNGNADVIVCDGFIGNVSLKISEGIAETMIALIKQALTSSLLGKIGFLILKPAFKTFKKRVDYAEYGGAPLLGVNGVCIICHGGSNTKAIKNAVRLAGELVQNKVLDHIREEIEKDKEKSKNLLGKKAPSVN